MIRTGDVLAITTVGAWTDITPPSEVCTRDCERVSASCEIGPLPAGSYTVRYGSKMLPLVVPSQLAAPPCFTAGG